MRQPLLFIVMLSLASASCKSTGSDPCQDAKTIYMTHARKKLAAALASVTDSTNQAKLKQDGEAELQRADARFVGVCKELGGAKTLACAAKAEALDAAKDPAANEKLRTAPECDSMESLQSKLYAP